MATTGNSQPGRDGPRADDQDRRLAYELGDVRRARAALAWLFEPTAPTLRALLAAYSLPRLAGGLPNLVFRTPEILRREVGHRPPEDLRAASCAVLGDAHEHGRRVIVPEDPEWPPGLADLARPDRDPTTPAALCLWVRGDRPVAATLHRSVTVVGARAATAYGVHVASQLGHDLADQRWTVLGTGGFGIDSAALRGALAAGGAAVAVLPGGLDRPHPAAHTALFDQIAGHGLLVSMWPPGTAPTRDRATINQSMMAALTCGTVMVEAAPRSAAITTLTAAIAGGRPGMVVPGPVTSVLSTGCHHALREITPARLVTSADDVLTELMTSCVDTRSAPLLPAGDVEGGKQ